jgi:hypothetical protein
MPRLALSSLSIEFEKATAKAMKIFNLIYVQSFRGGKEVHFSDDSCSSWWGGIITRTSHARRSGKSIVIKRLNFNSIPSHGRSIKGPQKSPSVKCNREELLEIQTAARRRLSFRARPNQLFIHTKSSAMLHDNILIGYEQ